MPILQMKKLRFMRLILPEGGWLNWGSNPSSPRLVLLVPTMKPTAVIHTHDIHTSSALLPRWAWLG